MTRIVRRFPVSCGLGLLIVAPMVATEFAPSWYDWPARHLKLTWADLHSRHVYRLVSSTYVQSRSGVLFTIALLFCFVPLCEWRLRSRATLAAFVLGDAISSITSFLLLRALVVFDSATAQHALITPNSGSSAGCYACAGAFAMSWSSRTVRSRLLALLAIDLAIQALVSHMLSDLQHPIAALVGIGVAFVADRSRGARRFERSALLS
jgi:hypothetical protein